MIEVVEHRLLHQIRMHRRDTIDAVRSDECELSHPDPTAGFLVDQRYRSLEIDIAGTSRIGECQMRGVDAVDDLEVARQQPFEQFERPGLQRFRQQGMVGVG